MQLYKADCATCGSNHSLFYHWNMHDFAQYVQKQEKIRELRSSLWIRFIYTFINIYEFQK